MGWWRRTCCRSCRWRRQGA
uniref:Uncharacterized protein n=1 Tax=Arundo donax TaxID=35708 RepID=A0A0A9ER65_ARUDO